MLRVVVVDSTAESRNRIVRELTELLNTDSADLALLPRITAQPLTPREIKFHAAPDICIIGDRVATTEPAEIASIRKLLPDTPILVRLTRTFETLEVIEQLARMGADDTISETIESGEFFKKLVLHIRRRVKTRSGKLIVVDSGKGGIGVTTVAAGLGEALIDTGKRVAVCDFDFETQDLSRFLQARPYINENLQLLFERERPVTEEFVRQTLVPVWEEEEQLFCMPPSAEVEELYDARSLYPRVLISILEVLDTTYDVVVVDVGSARGAFLRTLYRVADTVIVLVNNNPASLYASVDKIGKVRSLMAPSGELSVICNGATQHGLPISFLRNELIAATKLSQHEVPQFEIPWSAQGSRWPGSGETIYSAGGSKVKRAFDELLTRLNLGTEAARPGGSAREEREMPSSATRAGGKGIAGLFSFGGLLGARRASQALSMPHTSRTAALIDGPTQPQGRYGAELPERNESAPLRSTVVPFERTDRETSGRGTPPITPHTAATAPNPDSIFEKPIFEHPEGRTGRRPTSSGERMHEEVPPVASDELFTRARFS